MTTDPYMDAINAGAAALAKPYRDPDTISAFVETFPTIAAARVIDAALPHLRATVLAEAIPPGPCPEASEFGQAGPYADGVNPEPRTLRALCDLRAGHAGQHEAYDDDWGTYRWTRTDMLPSARCTLLYETSPQEIVNHNSRVPAMALLCERTSGHPGWHIAGTHVWDGRGELVLT
jgi:hypothetical protein